MIEIRMALKIVDVHVTVRKNLDEENHLLHVVMVL